jgi:hypothetical protein
VKEMWRKNRRKTSMKRSMRSRSKIRTEQTRGDGKGEKGGRQNKEKPEKKEKKTGPCITDVQDSNINRCMCFFIRQP